MFVYESGYYIEPGKPTRILVEPGNHKEQLLVETAPLLAPLRLKEPRAEFINLYESGSGIVIYTSDLTVTPGNGSSRNVQDLGEYRVIYQLEYVQGNTIYFSAVQGQAVGQVITQV